MTFLTTRFTTETFQENKRYRDTHNIPCIYSSSLPISDKLPYQDYYVLEMNNSTNKVEGIGLIKNKPESKKYYKVHSDGNTNRYTYIGEYYIERDIIDDYNAPLLYALEEILFKGKTHSKRGSGLTTIPERVLKFDVCEGINVKKEIKELFIYHFRESLRRDNETKPIEEKIEIS